MKIKNAFIGLLAICFMSPLVQAQDPDVQITPDQFKYIKTPLSLTEADLGAWLVAVKNHVNRNMLNIDSQFRQTLNRKGNLTARERHLMSYRAEVRPLENVPHTYIAMFYSRAHMNETLIRSSLYQDGGPGIDAGVLTRGQHFFFHESLEAARGLNIRSETLEELNHLTFSNRDATLANSNSPFYEEQLFLELVYQKLKKINPDNNFFLISTNVVGFSLDTVGHEILHALYDSNRAYKDAVTQFWLYQVSEEDKASIRSILGSIYSSESVIVDEFQAYLLQPKVPVPQSELLAAYVPKYYEALVQEMKKISLPVPFTKPDVNSGCRPLL